MIRGGYVTPVTPVHGYYWLLLITPVRPRTLPATSNKLKDTHCVWYCHTWLTTPVLVNNRCVLILVTTEQCCVCDMLYTVTYRYMTCRQCSSVSHVHIQVSPCPYVCLFVVFMTSHKLAELCKVCNKTPIVLIIYSSAWIWIVIQVHVYIRHSFIPKYFNADWKHFFLLMIVNF